MSKLRAIGLLSGLVLLQVVLISTLPSAAVARGNLEPDDSGSMYLLQPLDAGSNEIDAQGGIDIFFTYFNRAWPWLMGTAAGLAVLQAIVGGVEIMISSGGEKRSAGIERLQWAIAGLVILVLAGLILRTLNPIFYK